MDNMTREEQIYEASDKYESYRESLGVKDPIALDEIGEAFYTGAEWADAHPQDRWISVEDEQPEDGKVYLVYHKDGTIYFSRYYPGCPITHWMPVPRPPKEGGEK